MKHTRITLPVHLLIIFVVAVVEIIWPSKAWGAASQAVNASVNLSVCGNTIAEGGEDCDGTDLASQTCVARGFTGGVLGCDISCSFETALCSTPVTEVTAAEIEKLASNGTLEPAFATEIENTTSIEVVREAVITIVEGEVSSSVSLSEGTVIETVDDTVFDGTKLSLDLMEEGEISGLAANWQTEGALQWGVVGETLSFSKPVAIRMEVSTC